MNLEFEEAAVNPKLKKVTKKNPKIPDELAAYLPSSPPLAVSRLRDDNTEADVDHVFHWEDLKNDLADHSFLVSGRGA